MAHKFVGEFRTFLKERKIEAERRRLVALHEALADRLENTKAEHISKLLDPSSDADIRATPDWCSRFVDETYTELDGKETVKPIRYPDATRVWGIIKKRNSGNIAKKDRRMREVRMKNLRDFGKITHDQDDTREKLPSGCGSGMIISHFSYIAGHKQGLLSPDHFSFKSVKNRPTSKALALLKRKGTVLTLHEAVDSGRVEIVSCSGNSYGKNALHLALRTCQEGDGPFTVAVQKGTIFQHTDWVHKQNLMVIRTRHMKFLSGKAGLTCEKRINAHCMNSMCCCSSGESMTLTKFYFDEPALGVQGRVWNFLDKKFQTGRKAKVKDVCLKSGH